MSTSSSFSTHPIYVAIMSPIKGDSPSGHLAESDSRYNFMMDELRKVGSLQQDTIEWGKLKDKVLELLSGTTKDVHCLAALSLALLHMGKQDDAPLVVGLLAGFIHAWKDSGFPLISTPRGKKQWSNRLTQISQRLVPLLESQEFLPQDIAMREACDRLKQLLTEQEWLGEAGMSVLVRSIRFVDTATVLPVQAQAAIISARPGSGGAKSAVPMASKVTLSDREVRQFCQQLIQHQQLTGHWDEISFRLRRYMIWQGIDNLPVADDSGRIPLMAPPADLRREYQEQLRRGVEGGWWEKLERTLETSPYWLSGHYLSYQYAKYLSQTDIADAIASEASRFFMRHPNIAKLGFSDKGELVPCADADALAWLQQASENAKASVSHHSIYLSPETNDGDVKRVDGIVYSPLPPDLVKECQAAMEGRPLDVALQVISRHLSQGLEPRSRCYTVIALAEVYEQLGLVALAQEQYRQLSHWVKADVQLQDWEPNLLGLLQGRLKTK